MHHIDAAALLLSLIHIYLQQDLTTLGYYWAKITGNFGEKTEAAVKRFQEENGLTADGVAGTKMCIRDSCCCCWAALWIWRR